MELRKSLFWDTDYDKLDWDKHISYVVSRVLQRGTLEDFRNIVAYYGKEKLREVIKNIRYLDKKPMYFSSIYFEIPLTEIRCYNIRQSRKLHWDY